VTGPKTFCWFKRVKFTRWAFEGVREDQKVGWGVAGRCALVLIINTNSRFWNPVFWFWVLPLDLSHQHASRLGLSAQPPLLSFLSPFFFALFPLFYQTLLVHFTRPATLPSPLLYDQQAKLAPSFHGTRTGLEGQVAYGSFIFHSRRGARARALRRSSKLARAGWNTSPPPKLNVCMHACGDMFISEFSSFPFAFFSWKNPFINRYWSRTTSF
jgi:hypothetical protein